jgi:CheY-like chemotaxis protein
MIGKRTILVVDDDPDIRRMLRRMLESDGYHLVEAADGLEALGRVRSEPPDLIFLDLLMPGLDGWGVLRALRQDPATETIPVVLISGHVMADASQVREWGAVALLRKPFRLAALRALAEDLLTPQHSKEYGRAQPACGATGFP